MASKRLPDTVKVTLFGKEHEAFLRTIGDGNQGYYIRDTQLVEGVPCVVMLTVSDKPARK